MVSQGSRLRRRRRCRSRSAPAAGLPHRQIVCGCARSTACDPFPSMQSMPVLSRGTSGGGTARRRGPGNVRSPAGDGRRERPAFSAAPVRPAEGSLSRAGVRRLPGQAPDGRGTAREARSGGASQAESLALLAQAGAVRFRRHAKVGERGRCVCEMPLSCDDKVQTGRVHTLRAGGSTGLNLLSSTDRGRSRWRWPEGGCRPESPDDGICDWETPMCADRDLEHGCSMGRAAPGPARRNGWRPSPADGGLSSGRSPGIPPPPQRGPRGAQTSMGRCRLPRTSEAAA